GFVVDVLAVVVVEGDIEAGIGAGHRRLLVGRLVELLEEAAGPLDDAHQVALVGDRGVDEIEAVLRAGAGDVEEAPLLLLPALLLDRAAVGELALDEPEEEHGPPLEALGLVHRGQDEAVLLLGLLHRVLAGDAGGERELGEQRLHVRVAQREVGEAAQVLEARGEIGEARLQVVLVALVEHETDHVRGGLGPLAEAADQDPEILPAPQGGPGDDRLHVVDAVLLDQPPDLLGGGLAHARDELEDALPGELVLRVHGDLEVGGDVLQMGLLEEAEAAADLEGDLLPGELHLELHRVVVGAVEDGAVAQVEALVLQVDDPLGDEARLLGRVAGADGLGPAAFGADRAEGLLELALVVGDGVVREPEDLRDRAVVDLELVDLRLRVPLGKIDDVGEIRAAEGVDRLRVVADDHEVAVDAGDELDDLRLQPVRVLVLVDEHVAPELVLLLADLGVLRQQLMPEDEQIVEVHEVKLALAAVIAPAGGLHKVLDLVERGVLRGDELLEGEPRVAGVAGDLEEDVALGELDALVGAAVHRGEIVHELAGVLAVEDREVGLVADERRVAAE